MRVEERRGAIEGRPRLILPAPRTRITIIALLCCVPGLAAAQECVGAAPFAAGRWRMGLAAERHDDGSRLLATLALGGRAAFAEIAGGVAAYDAFDDPGGLVRIAAGRELVLARGIRACPIAALLVGFGPRRIGGGDVDASTLDARLGMEFGRAIPMRRRARLVPVVGLSLRWARLGLDVPESGETFRRTDTYGTIDAGVGITFRSRASLVSRVSVPFASANASPTYSMAVAVSMGGAR